MSNISEIVDVQIEIESPVTSPASFSDLLIIVPKPTNAGDYVMTGVIKVSSANDLLDYGYMESDTAFLAVMTAFAQNPGPTELYVIARETVISDGENDETIETPEAITETLNRAINATGSWYGFALAEIYSAIDHQDAAIWAEANTKLYGFTWTGSECPISVTPYDHTFALYAGDGSETTTAIYGAIALMAKCFGYDPGSETWGLKSLASVEPTEITTAKRAELEAIPSNYYTAVANKNIVREGKVGSGEWIDIIRFKDWLVNEIQVREYNYLTSVPKVPFNDDGITGVQNVLEGVLQAAQRTGGIDQDRFDEDGNAQPGYTVSVPLAANISKADRKARKLRNVIFTARLAGAIHMIYIRGSLVY